MPNIDFLTSLALILLSSLVLGSIFRACKLPPLLGMLLVGIILGPHLLNLIAGPILEVSSSLREIALIVILTRAGLSLNLKDLKIVGRPAVLLCMVPALTEILGYMLFATLFVGTSLLESAIIGTVIAAVSPAVVVPRMIALQEQRYGTLHSVPQMVNAGSSMDDIFVIVAFTALVGMAKGGNFDFGIFWEVPVSIVLGIVVGAGVGYALVLFFRHVHTRDTVKIIVMISFAFLFVTLENAISKYVPFSAMLAVVTVGVTYNALDPIRSARLSKKYEKIWVLAEIILFVLVGAAVDLKYVADNGGIMVAVIFLALLFRMGGVFLSLIRTPLTIKERTFCAIAYIPKATVQAALGAIPLAMGLGCGPVVLTAAVLSIIITAPLGAFAIDLTSHRLLPLEPLPPTDPPTESAEQAPSAEDAAQ